MEHSTLVGRSILVLEGDHHLAGYLRDTLEGPGVHVALASSAAEALAIIEAAGASAIIASSCPAAARMHVRKGRAKTN